MIFQRFFVDSNLVSENIDDFLIPLEKRTYNIGNAIFLSHKTIHKFITDIGVFYNIYYRTTGAYFEKSYRSMNN